MLFWTGSWHFTKGSQTAKRPSDSLDINNLTKQQRLDPTAQATFNADEELQRAGAPNYKRVVKKHVLQYMSRLGIKEAKEFAASLPSTQKKGRKSAYVKTKEHTLPDIKEVSCCSTPYVCIL